MIERAPFGSTGHASSRVIFGAAALGWATQETADEVFEVLREFGVNHLDTAAVYGDSELRIAPWMVEHRDDFFLATKTDERTRDAARAGLERSLERLGVDHVDLIQLHNLVEPDEWEVAHGKGGAVEALAKARDEGLVGAIGVTGHGLRIAGMHLRSLAAFPFDSVLFPYNQAVLADASYRGEVERLLALCAERGVAVQAIKALARRRWTEERLEEVDRKALSWYEPLDDPAAIRHGVNFVLARSQLFLNSSSDYRLLRATLEVASQPSVSPSLEELAADREAQDIHSLFDGAELDRI